MPLQARNTEYVSPVWFVPGPVAVSLSTTVSPLAPTETICAPAGTKFDTSVAPRSAAWNLFASGVLFGSR